MYEIQANIPQGYTGQFTEFSGSIQNLSKLGRDIDKRSAELQSKMKALQHNVSMAYKEEELEQRKKGFESQKRMGQLSLDNQFNAWDKLGMAFQTGAGIYGDWQQKEAYKDYWTKQREMYRPETPDMSDEIGGEWGLHGGGF